jgi:hypothetical protein
MIKTHTKVEKGIMCSHAPVTQLQHILIHVQSVSDDAFECVFPLSPQPKAQDLATLQTCLQGSERGHSF